MKSADSLILTAGEIKLSTIQKNIKRAMKEEFSLFSLGIGFDVDYDFLERIAAENRGMAQRIYANHDAAEQLRVRHLQRSCQRAIFSFHYLSIKRNARDFFMKELFL